MATERAYVIKVAAVLDRSTAAAVGDAVQQYDRVTRASARSARDQQAVQERAQRHVAGIRDRYFRDQQRIEEKASRDAERIKERQAANETRIAKTSSDKAERETQSRIRRETREHERAQDYVARIKDRHFRDEQRREEQRARQTDNERRQRVASIAQDAYGTAKAIGRKALETGGSLARGFGVDLSMERGVSRAVQLEQSAIAITNAGNRGGSLGDAEARARQPGELQALARGIGNKYAFDPNEVLQGLSQYQALTGDLATGQAGLKGLGELAAAFNVDLDKMIASAGQVGSAIGDVGKEFATPEEKAKAVLDVMKSLTAQGQEGAIEIGDMATQMAKLKAAGGRFEGNTADSIKRMGALAQLSLQLGGAGGGGGAATSVMGFANTLATPTRRAKFKQFGVDIMSKNDPGAFADPFEIIKRSLVASGGDVEKMKQMWANVIAERAVTALSTTYRKAGGGDKGLEAVDAQFARFGGTVTQGQIDENLSRRMGSKGAQAQVAQNEMDQVWADLTQEVAPALKELVPVARDVAKAWAGMVTTVAKHPWGSLAAAIGLSITGAIAKAAIGEALKNQLLKLLAGSGAGAGGGGGGGGGGKGMGILGGVAAVAAIGAAGYAGYQGLKKGFDEAGKAQTASVETDAQVMNALSSARAAAKGKMKPEEVLAELEAASAAQQKRILNAQKDIGYLDAINPFSDTTFAQVGAHQQDAGQVDRLKEDLAQVKAAMDAVKAQLAGGIKVSGSVTVDNMPTGGPPGANGRVGTPDDPP